MHDTQILRHERQHAGFTQMLLISDPRMMNMLSKVTNATGQMITRGVNDTVQDVMNVTKDVEEEIVLFWDAPHTEWLILLTVVMALLCLDAFVSSVSQRSNGGGGDQRKHAAMMVGWVLFGLGYNAAFAWRNGSKDGIDWFIGYALEWMLSLDNLFAFQFIVRIYGAPLEIRRKALFFGVVFSVISRLLLFCAVGYVIHSIHYVQFAFGFLLIYAGIQALQDDGDDKDPRDMLLIRLLKRCLGPRLQERYDLESHRLFVWDENGKLCATLLVPLIICVEATDLIFAVDSVSAKVAQIPNQYICYSSSVLALLGLRAMYFVIDDLVKYFTMLKYGVSFILVFIGGELMMTSKYQLPDWIVCAVIVTVFNICIVLSMLRTLISGKTNVGGSNTCPKATGSEQGSPPLDKLLVEERETNMDDARGLGESLPALPEKQFSGQSEELRQKMERRFLLTEPQDAPSSSSSHQDSNNDSKDRREHPCAADSAAG